MFIEIADDETINTDQITSFKPFKNNPDVYTVVVTSDGNEYLVEMPYSEFKRKIGLTEFLHSPMTDN